MNVPKVNTRSALELKLTRRRFIRQTALGAVALSSPPLLAAESAPDAASPLWGICRGPGEASKVAEAGYDYIEPGVRSLLVPGKSEQQFERELARIRDAHLTVRACNSFFPGDMKLVGAEPKTAAALRHGEIAFERAAKAGVQIIVLGSGGARRIPEGFAPAEARQQFVRFCRQLGPLAHTHGVTVALEPLNRGETNFLNSVSEGVGLVDEVGHPSIQLVADIYHMMKENESADSIRKAGPRVCHCHVAEREGRTPPGTEGDDFRPYFAALQAISFPGAISVECRWPKEVEILPVMLKARQVISEQWART